jgi:hypothetical protein
VWLSSCLSPFLLSEVARPGVGLQAYLSQLGASLGVSHTTARAYIELLARTFMVRVQPAFLPNSAKRLMKSPKIGPEPALVFQGRPFMEHQPGYRPPRVTNLRVKT